MRKTPVLVRGQLCTSTKVEKPREPLRTITELAGEHGISVATMSRRLQHPAAPRPITTSGGGKVYFRPSEVRKFLNTIH